MPYSRLLDEIPNIYYGFGSKVDLTPNKLIPYQARQPIKKQVHGTDIKEVCFKVQNCGEVDGLITSCVGIPLSVITADCVPIVFCRRDGKRVGVVHAGWRGLLAGIIEKMTVKIQQNDTIFDWLAVIGPAAGSCCYEVSEELTTLFSTQLNIQKDFISPKPNYLDLPGIARNKLITAGLEHIEIIEECTICKRVYDSPANENNPFKYNSYRRNSQIAHQNNSSLPLLTHQYSGIVITSYE